MYDKSGLKTMSLKLDILGSTGPQLKLVRVCFCQQFVLENCDGTSVLSIIRKTLEARDRAHDSWFFKPRSFTTTPRKLLKHDIMLSELGSSML